MIDQIIFFDINIYSVILLVIMILIKSIKKDFFSFSSSLFTWIIIFNIIGLILEPITWLLDGKIGNGYFIFGHISNVLLIMTAPILIGLWASYLDYKLFSSKKRILKLNYYQVPSMVILLLIIINFFTPILYTIDSQTNIYTSGSLQFLRYVLSYILFFRLMYLVFTNNTKENAFVIRGIILFLILPAVGAIIQFIYPSLLFTWSSLALSVLVVYIFLETTSGNQDYLTKLYSRRLLENYLTTLIEDHIDFQVVMMDLDRFKNVNDLYGHSVGDQVLIRFSNIIKSSIFNSNVFASRLGGDEFLVVLKGNDSKDSVTYIQSIRDDVKKDEYLSKFTFLNFSAGFITYDHIMTIDDILTGADHRMYKEKELQKEDLKDRNPSEY
jgi:diguanylate cyclase (GGDEF)-like protein